MGKWFPQVCAAEPASLPTDTLQILNVSTGSCPCAGGRVLGVTATGKNVLEAQQKAYAAVDAIDFDDGFCRRDIGWRAVERLQKAAR